MDSTTQSSAAIDVGTVISARYRIVKRLGDGGMGQVFLAHDTQLGGEPIAIKVLHRDLSANSAHRERFLREVQLTRKVTDNHVVRTFDVGVDGERLYLTMEYIEGVTLKEWLEGNKSHSEIIRLIEEICDGLTAIHKAGIVHRDLKPGNIIVTGDGTIKIADFGIARPKSSELTKHHEIVGSAQYMAPEVWRGKNIGPATDLYALGVIWYELVTGILPFDGESPAETMGRHLNTIPLHPAELIDGVPIWIDSLITQILAKEYGARPQTAASIRTAIQKGRAQAHNLDGFNYDLSPVSLDSALILEGDPDQPLVIAKRTLSDAPTPLDPESAKNAAISYKNKKRKAVPLFGKPITHFTPGVILTLAARALLGTVLALALGYAIVTGYGGWIKGELSGLSANSPLWLVASIALGILLQYALLAALPVLAIAAVTRSALATIKSSLVMFVLSGVLIVGYAAFSGVKLESQHGGTRYTAATVLAASEVTAKNSFEALMLIPQATILTPRDTIRLSIMVDRTPSWVSYAPYGVLLFLYTVLLISCSQGIKLVGSNTQYRRILPSAIAITLICGSSAIIVRTLLSYEMVNRIVTTSAPQAITVNLGALAHTIEPATLGASIVNWGVVIVALTVVSIRRKNLGLED